MAQKRGWHTCPSKSIPAGEIERFVVDQLRGIGKDPTLVNETLERAGARADEERAALESEQRGLERDLAAWNAEVRGLAVDVARGGNPSSLRRLADLQERIRTAEERASLVHDQFLALEDGRITEEDVAAALAAFEPVWNALSPKEQARIVRLLVERVDYDGARGQVSITYHPAGFKTLAAEQATVPHEKRA